MERTRVWKGAVKPESRDEHERFITFLNSPEAAVQYAKFFLTGYTLAQDDDDLTVVLKAEEPQAFIRFLRNHRMWPEFWEFRANDPSGADPPDEQVRVRWRREAVQ
jgi:hypothetical protein